MHIIMKHQFKNPTYQVKVHNDRKSNSLAKKINFIFVHFIAQA